MEVIPQRATVRPRIRAGGGSTLLEDEILPLVCSNERGLIGIFGGAGSGKTTALRHVACLIPPEYEVYFFDYKTDVRDLSNSLDGVVIYGSGNLLAGPQDHLAQYHLAPWGDDDVIEYLLSAHREKCGEIMQRLKQYGDLSLLNGNPALIRLVLDEMSANPQLNSAADVILRKIAAEIDKDRLNEIRKLAVRPALLANSKSESDELRIQERLRIPDGPLCRLLRHWYPRALLARDQILSDLRAKQPCSILEGQISREFVALLASRLTKDDAAVEQLRLMLSRSTAAPMCVSILHNAGLTWDIEKCRSFHGAYLRRSKWREMNLNLLNFDRADLLGADFSLVVLNRISMQHASLTRVNFRNAELKDVDARHANCSRADFASATMENFDVSYGNLSGGQMREACCTTCRFEKTDLSGTNLNRSKMLSCNFLQATIDGADFSDVKFESSDLSKLRLTRACFDRATFKFCNLKSSDLECMKLPDCDFSDADLTGAYLTSTYIPRGNFNGAKLCGAGLADIDWEGASLRGADFTNASFHLGSARSGLVHSPIACEGSKTGFYTDEFHEQHFKAPEQIRKANLRGADLTGAIVYKTDFYLVDLRDAIYDDEQKRHFQQCKAILR